MDCFVWVGSLLSYKRLTFSNDRQIQRNKMQITDAPNEPKGKSSKHTKMLTTLSFSNCLYFWFRNSTTACNIRYVIDLVGDNYHCIISMYITSYISQGRTFKTVYKYNIQTNITLHAHFLLAPERCELNSLRQYFRARVLRIQI